MQYAMDEGSRFVLHEVCGPNGEHAYTSVSAYIDGIAFCGRSVCRMEDLSDEDALQCLQTVPPECIYPKFDSGEFTLAPEFDKFRHFLKPPSYEWDDCQPGKTFVADCVLQEIHALELIRKNPQPALVSYHGCVVKADRVTHLCLEKYEASLDSILETSPGRIGFAEASNIIDQVEAGINHLHSLSLAHNDINEHNICLNMDKNPVIVDFDSCLPFGKPLTKGFSSQDCPTSSPDNDYAAISCLADLLLDNNC
ncbi:hypothetical protein K470DRAFT_156087 [Piedraia hortae CBS 480.64]|uniref:Protein kinase domain-containing protein n=1 Tax=Piedraia hortae CBS 480.64 TaxID=1314780 RepID=A0A6A7C7K9_9PEZI|nr:hypothetical protein K470DRAFT_156087 [Piedraia hortae CBS 480.64]